MADGVVGVAVSDDGRIRTNKYNKHSLFPVNMGRSLRYVVNTVNA